MKILKLNGTLLLETKDADLCGADLRNADLRDANLCRANLCDADLRGADLCKCIVCDANFNNAIVSYRGGVCRIRFEDVR